MADLQAQLWQLGNLTNDLTARLTRDEADYNESLDNTWILLTGTLVWIMSAGFTFLEMGSLRFKNSQNILLKNLAVPVLGFMAWYITGYAIAFGATPFNPGKFASGRLFAMDGFWNERWRFRHWFFQGCFCDTSASIVSGAVAERIELLAFMLHATIITGVIYPIPCYWAWSGYGWLNYQDPSSPNSAPVFVSSVGPPYLDWAGSGVIHLVGGASALVGSIVLGPRKGRFTSPDQSEFTGHSPPFTVLGTFILWFGWYGFNAGSVGSMHTANAAYSSALVAVNSTLSPCMGGIVVFALRKLFFDKCFDVGGFCNGALAGLVAITAGCGWVKPWEAVIIGVIGGLVYQINCLLMVRLKIDDPIDAISVHFANGVWGTLAVGFFGDPAQSFCPNGLCSNGVFYKGTQLGVQALGVLVEIAWSAVLSICVFVPMRLAGVLRMPDHVQEAGADLAQHSPAKSYSAGGPPKELTV